MAQLPAALERFEPAARSTVAVQPAMAVRPAVAVRQAAGWAGAWLGVLAVAGGALWLSATGVAALWRSGDLTASVLGAPGRMAGPGLVGVVVATALAERRWPAVRRPLLSRGHLADAAYLALFASLVAPLVTVLDTGFAAALERHAPAVVLGRLPVVPQVAAIVAVLVGTDALNWLAHLANHRSGALWRLHALHHSQEDMSVLTTFRTHPLSHVSYLPALLPALVLGASGPAPSAALVVYSALVTVPHANLPWTFGPLGRVLVSPAYHRLHHAAGATGPRDGVNFGFALVCWDQLAARARYPTGGSPVATGIAGRPVPVEQAAGRRSLAAVMGAQLVQPFAPHPATGRRP